MNFLKEYLLEADDIIEDDIIEEDDKWDNLVETYANPVAEKLTQVIINDINNIEYLDPNSDFFSSDFALGCFEDLFQDKDKDDASDVILELLHRIDFQKIWNKIVKEKQIQVSDQMFPIPDEDELFLERYYLPHAYKEGTDIDYLIISVTYIDGELSFGYKTQFFGDHAGYESGTEAFTAFENHMESVFIADWGFDFDTILYKDEKTIEHARDVEKSYSRYFRD